MTKTFFYFIRIQKKKLKGTFFSKSMSQCNLLSIFASSAALVSHNYTFLLTFGQSQQMKVIISRAMMSSD